MLQNKTLKMKRTAIKKAKEQLGKYGQHKSQCLICLDNGLAVKKSVWAHADGNNTVSHTYCTEGINRWVKIHKKCPYCSRQGEPLRLYFTF